LKGDFPVYAAEVNLNIACKSYFHILQPFVFAKVISAASDFGVEITFSNEKKLRTVPASKAVLDANMLLMYNVI